MRTVTTLLFSLCLTVSVFSQTFLEQTPISFVQNIEFCSSASGDINGDGYKDLIITGQNNANNGATETFVYLNGASGFNLSSAGITNGAKRSWIDLGDYDNDGDLDVVMQGWNNISGTDTQKAYIYNNNGNGIFTLAVTLPEGRSNGTISWGDYDNDGDLDILQTGWFQAETTGKTTIYTNNGSNNFTILSQPIEGLADGQARWGDYDKDGKLDVIIAGWNKTKLYKGNGLGVFTEINTTLPHYDFAWVNWIDYDKDGNLDLVISGLVTGSNPTRWETKVLKGSSTNIFTEMPFNLNGVQFGPILLGDVNKDGYNDFFIAGWANGGVFQIYKNDGSNNQFNLLAGINTTITGWADGTMQVADFNNDGYDEIFKCGWNNTKLYVNEQTCNFRSKSSGNWEDINIWEVSSTGINNWINATSIPANYAASISILNPHNITITSNNAVRNLNINSGSLVQINSGKQFTINNSLSNNGMLLLKSSETDGSATILTPTSIAGTGVYSVEQYLASGRNWYVSSPVSNAQSGIVNTNANNLLYERDMAGNSWNQITATNTTLTPMKGYVVNVQNSGVITFSGDGLNNGIQSIPLQKVVAAKGNYNLVGNPYPSQLTWTSALATAANVSTTIWYRTKPTVWAFHSYNASSDIGSPLGTTGLIPPMQAFWVKVNDSGTAGTLSFTNANRLHSTSTNLLKAPVSNPNKLIRIKLSNTINTDETVLSFNENASNEFDDYDSEKMFNDVVDFPEIYTSVSSKDLVINGMNSYDFNTVIPLVVKLGQKGTYFLNSSGMQNFDVDTKIILKDNLTNLQTDLTSGESYTFTSDSGISSTRFSLLFKSVSGTTELTNYNSEFDLFCREGSIVILNNSGLKNILTSLYNSQAQLIDKKFIGSGNCTLFENLKPGFYVLEINYLGSKIIKKAILK